MNRRQWIARGALLCAGLGAFFVIKGKTPVATDVTIALDPDPQAEQLTVRIGTLDHDFRSTATFYRQNNGEFPKPMKLTPNLAPGEYLVEIDVTTKTGSRSKENRIELSGHPVTLYAPRER